MRPGGQVDLGLGHARHDGLDRVFERRQAALAFRASGQLPQASVDRGCLAAARRAGEHDRPRSFAEQPAQAVLHFRGQAQIFDPEEMPRRREQTNDGLLAEKRGKRAHPHLDFAGSALIRPSCGTSVR